MQHFHYIVILFVLILEIAWVIKNIFNYRVSRARRTIENTFGILSQRWRILRRPILASVEVFELVVQATVVLHNFLQNSENDLLPSERKYCPTGYWRLDNPNLRSVNKLASNNHTNLAKYQRDILADYFVSPKGSVPWQNEYVHQWEG